jgi:hypothetical protein
MGKTGKENKKTGTERSTVKPDPEKRVGLSH